MGPEGRHRQGMGRYVKKVSEPTLGLDANIKIWQKWYDKYTK